MNYRSALLIKGTSGVHNPAIENGIRSIGFAFNVVDADAAIDYLKEHSLEGTDPAVVVLDPSIENGLPLARRLRVVWPHGEVLFVPDNEEADRLRQQLRYAPMIGTNWSMSEPDNPRLPHIIKRAAETSRQQVRLRTTLKKANASMGTSAAPRIEHYDYHRLAVSEHYLASVLEQSQQAILSLDMRNRILFWSVGAEHLFKRTAQAMSGRHVSDMPFWSDEIDACLNKIQNGTCTLTRETKAQLPAGRVDIEIIFSGVNDNAGRLIGTSLSLRDISARKQMLAQERDARQKAEETSRMKDEFLAILSHELRTPLSTVIGRTQLLQMKHRDNEELQASLDVIERNAQQQAKLIEDLLDISAVTAGKLRLNMEAVNLPELTQDVVLSVWSAAEKKQIEILEENMRGVAMIEGDPFRLRQVFLNLLNNAIKFTPPHGCIKVRSRWTSSQALVTVEDNGIGIPQEFLPMIFDRFGQVDSSSSRSFGGMGLGLSIAKQLIDLHHGHIEASSDGEGHGACFKVTLPLMEGQAESSRTAATAPDNSAPLAGYRVLLVEDVADAREMITDMLVSQGATVQSAESGRRALQMLDSYKPDVLVSDIGMPQMDGYRLLQEIRQRGYSNDKLPALALTAFASSADRAKAQLAGFQTHVAKPLVLADLVNAIVGIAPKQRQNPGIS